MSDREQDGAALPPGFDDFYRKTYARVLAWALFGVPVVLGKFWSDIPDLR